MRGNTPYGRVKADPIAAYPSWFGLEGGASVGAMVGALLITALVIISFVLVFVWHFGTGVWTVNGQKQNVVLAGGPGVNVTIDPSTGDIVIDSTGLLSDTAGPGITISTTNGSTTISHTISDGTLLLAESDPGSPQVAYGININCLNNSWDVTTTTGTFPGTFIPGVVAGDGGQGNAGGGTAWSVPAAGLYAFNAHCIVTPSSYTVNDYLSASVALSLNASSVDPTTGTIPAGGYSTLSLSVGSAGAAGPSVHSAVSLSATVHACSSCAVQVGAPLHLHARLDHAGSGAQPTAAFVCHLQVSRQV
jgi:hypothetical protein